MKIDKDKLTNLLVNKTGLEKQQVREQLNELIDQIRKAAKRGKSFEIEGFGVFSVKEEILQFEPSESLETEINHKYAGMKPIELIGAYKDTPDVKISESGKEKSEAKSSGVKGDREKEKEEEEILNSREAKKPSFRLDTNPPAEQMEQIKESDMKQPATAGPGEKETKQTTVERKASEKQEDSSSLDKILAAAVIVIALGISGWFVYDLGLFNFVTGNGSGTKNMTEQQYEKQNAVEEAGPGQGLENSTTGEAETENTVSESEQKSSVSDTESTTIAEQSNSSIYGLRDGDVSQAAEGYTIVVHSLKDESKAKGLESDFNRSGYLTILDKAVVNGQTYWRVGLGQFKTVADAQQAAKQLPESYRENHFIRKFKN